MKRSKEKSRSPTSDDLGIIPVGELKRSRSWGIYGKSGTGKTTFASTFPKPILLIDISDQGTDSVADVEDLDVKELLDFEDIEDLLIFLQKNRDGYKTVIFDTVTQLQRLVLEHLASKKGKDTSNIGDWGSMTRRDWGDAAAIMKNIITDFRNLNMEVVFLSQQRTTDADEDDGGDDMMLIPEVGFDAMKSVAGHLAACVSVIGQTFIRMKPVKKERDGNKKTEKKAQYMLRIGPNPYYLTKIRKKRSEQPPQAVVDPTYEDIVDIIKGS